MIPIAKLSGCMKATDLTKKFQYTPYDHESAWHMGILPRFFNGKSALQAKIMAFVNGSQIVKVWKLPKHQNTVV